jgi:RNA polymerase sigma-70 factor (ECF subfamily)
VKHARAIPNQEEILIKQERSILDLFKSISRSPISSREAFSALYEHTHLSVFRYIFGLLGGKQEEAEDLASETYLRAWRARKDFTGDGDGAVGWLFTIARRQVIDAYRGKAVRPVVDGDLEADLLDERTSPEGEVIQKEDQEGLWVRLGAIPAAAREMLVLRYLVGWKVNQIAAHMDIPENTVSVTMQRALEKLRTAWQPEDERK